MAQHKIDALLEKFPGAKVVKIVKIKTDKREEPAPYACGYCGCKEEPVVDPHWGGWPECPNCGGV